MSKIAITKNGNLFGVGSKFIRIFEINIVLNNIYNAISKIETTIDTQMYITPTGTYLIASTNRDSENKAGIKALKELKYNFHEKTQEDLEQILLDILNNSIEMAKTKFNINHIIHNNRYYRILNVKEFPGKLNPGVYAKYGAVSLHIQNLEKAVYDKISDSIEKEYQYHNERASSMGYATFYPLGFKEERRKIREVSNWDAVSINMSVLVSGESLDELDKNTEDLLFQGQNEGLNLYIGTHNHSLNTLNSVLPFGLSIEPQIVAFVYDNNVRIFKPISYYGKNEETNNIKNIPYIGRPAAKLLKNMKSNFSLSNSLQKILPVRYIFENGLIETSLAHFTRIYSLPNLNYSLARDDEKQQIMDIWKDTLNSFDSDIRMQLFVSNDPIDIEEIQNHILIDVKDEKYKQYYEEYNGYLDHHIIEAKNKTAKRAMYLCISTTANSAEEAEEKIFRTYSAVEKNLSKKKCKLEQLHASAAINLMYFILNMKKFKEVNFDNQLSIFDLLMPPSIRFKSNFMQIEKNFKAVLYCRVYPGFARDSFFNEMLSMPFHTAVSLHVEPVDAAEAVNLVNRQILGMNTNVYQYKKTKRDVPYETRLALEEAEAVRDDLQRKSQKMFFVGMYISVSGENEKEVKSRVDIIKKAANKHSFIFQTLSYRQKEGLFTTMPLGVDLVKQQRTLLTDSTSVFIPFSNRSHFDKGGLLYGVDREKHLLVVNRMDKNVMPNPSGFILGVPGAGKSFFVKKEMIGYLLKDPNVDVLALDPENEYTPVVKAFGGEVIDISVDSKTYINPFDISDKYGDNEVDPIKRKTEFIITLVEMLTGKMIAEEKTICDRCIRSIYNNIYSSRISEAEDVPDLKLFYEELKKQPEKEAHSLALRIEIYAIGSLNLFSHKTNIDVHNRIVSFNIKNLGEQLKPSGMMVAMDYIWNRLTKNKDEGRITIILMDEIYLLFGNEQSADFVYFLYKRCRKYGGIVTGITQNVTDLLHSQKAATMLANAEFKIILNQAYSDIEELAKILALSESQKSYVTNADIGSGLLIVKGDVLPFTDLFPSNTELYKLMNTNVHEVKN